MDWVCCGEMRGKETVLILRTSGKANGAWYILSTFLTMFWPLLEAHA